MVGVGLVLGEEFGSSLAPGEASHFGSFFSSAGSKVALLVAFFRRLVRSRTLWVAFFSAPGQKSHFWSLCFVCFFFALFGGARKKVALLVVLFRSFFVLCVFLFALFSFFFERAKKKAKQEVEKKRKHKKQQQPKVRLFSRHRKIKQKTKQPKVRQKVGPPRKVPQKVGPPPKVRQKVGPPPKVHRKGRQKVDPF